MDTIGKFQSAQWGTVVVSRATYESATGPVAIVLTASDGEPLTKLSVNLYRPECSHDSKDLPPGCFFVNTNSVPDDLIAEAKACGLFVERDDLGEGESGFCAYPVWQVVAS